MIKNWKKTLVASETTIREVIENISENLYQIVLVVAPNKKLLGTITDGDIRRAILRGVKLDENAALIMQANPIVSGSSESREQILAMMQRNKLRQIPVVDELNRVTGLEILIDYLSPPKNDNFVVLMAGGLGSRLMPLTEECPKPLLKIGSKPILETIIDSFMEHGFFNFFIAVNFKAEKIKEYFGKGEKWGVNITYLHEKERLGTAGALNLLPSKPNKPIFVMNGDLLTKVNFQHLLDYHDEQGAMATMCVREYDFQVPYGVVKMDDHMIVGIDEKPIHSFFVNAGIYVLDPETLTLFTDTSYLDMTHLFDLIRKQGEEAAAFPIREYWMDIGHPDDFYKANGDFTEVFEVKKT